MKKSNLSSFDHLLMYKSPSKAKTFRSTQIIGTVSKDADETKLQNMIAAGMAIARFDTSETPVEEYDKVLKTLREALEKYNGVRKSKKGPDGESCCPNPDDCLDVPIATALDIKGACLTTGKPAEGQTITLVENEPVNLTINKEFAAKSDKGTIYIDYPKFLELSKKQEVLIGDKIKLRIEKVNTQEQVANCVVLRGGEITKVTDVFVPGVKLDLPPIGKEFLDILKFGKENSIDMIFVPIQDPQSFNMIKCHVNSEGSTKTMMVIAKLEGQSAVDNVDKIIEKADGVLIARGRLGKNMPPERVIVAQKCIIAKCLKAGIPSIVSSHMLETMGSEGKEATRAEISDIVNATLDGCDCTMLEDETLGQNAVECIQKMQDTILETEQMINYRRWFRDLITQVSVPSDTATTTAISACTAAMVTNASAIIVHTITGKTARLIAKYRPECPIVVVTPNASTVRQCLLLRGASPILVKEKFDKWEKNVDKSIESGLSFIHQSCIIHKFPSTVIAVLGQKEGSGNSNTVRIINVASKPEKQKAEAPKDDEDDDS